MGVIESLKDCKTCGDILIAGEKADVNSFQRILDGTQYLTIYKKSEVMAKKAAEVSINLANNEPTTNTLTIDQTPTLLFSSDVIIKKNIDITNLTNLSELSNN